MPLQHQRAPTLSATVVLALSSPLEVFTEHEAAALLPVPPVYDVPLFRSVKVHRDHHCEIGKALYSVPSAYIGAQVDARADSQLVKLFHAVS